MLRRVRSACCVFSAGAASFVWPPEPKGLIVVYPHTSNWDFPIGMLFRIGHGLPANWIGKAEMFRAPFRGLLLRIGGIPLDRSRATGFVDALVEEFRSRDWMWVAITPEGTRSHTGTSSPVSTRSRWPPAFRLRLPTSITERRRWGSTHTCA